MGYRTTRRKQINGATYKMLFTWGEGDPHILISFPGHTEHDTIGVYDHAAARSTIVSHADFLRHVSEYLAEVHPDTVLAHWNYRTQGKP